VADVLVVDAGSHSLRLVLVSPAGERAWEQAVESPPGSPEADRLLATFGDQVGSFGAVGYRIVHGGREVTEATLVDDAVIESLEESAYLAPLHVPPALRTLAELRRRLPDLPHVVAVDTAFHATMPTEARTYALPAEWRNRWDLQRYGFHGLSYASALPRAAAMLDKGVDEVSLVLAHLGGGSSVCAVRNGRSVWTSMGNTPLDGLVMGTRSGSVDPGLLFDLITQHGLSPDEVRDGLERHSGLLGLSGGQSNDTRDLASAAQNHDRNACLALDAFCLHVRQGIAAAAVCLEQLDALVFTGEISNDQPQLREAICAGLGPLGIVGGLGDVVDSDALISAQGAIPVITLIVQEDLQVAAETRRVLGWSD
jgi:acetate kinase